MAKITWDDLKLFGSYKNLRNSNLSWNDLNSDCIDLLHLINSQNLPVPKKFYDKVEALNNLAIESYEKHSNHTFPKNNETDIKEIIITLTIVIELLKSIIGLSTEVLSLKSKIEEDVHQIYIEVNNYYKDTNVDNVSKNNETNFINK